MSVEADAAPRAAALEQQQVAAVGVDVHEVGVQRADAQRSATEHHHRGADVVVGRADGARRLGVRPAARPSASRLEAAGGRGHDRRRRRCARRRARPSRGCARSPPVALVAHGDGAAGVDDPVDLAHVGQRRFRVFLVEGLHGVGQRGGAAGRRGQVRAGARRESRRGRRPASSWTVCIGARIRAKRRSSANVARVGDDAAHRPVARPARRARPAARRSTSSATTSWPRPREVERDAARARARRRGSGRRRRRRARARAAGPRRRTPHSRSCQQHVAHANEPSATPRATSSSRSSEHRGVGGQREERGRRRRPARRRAPRSSSGSTTMRSARGRPRTSAAAPARPRACPLQVARRTRRASTSKSASQTHETSRPSAVRSLRTARRSCSPVLERERAQHLVGARGVLDEQDRQVAPVERARSPRARRRPATASSPATTSASGAPSASASAAAASAL